MQVLAPFISVSDRTVVLKTQSTSTVKNPQMGNNDCFIQSLLINCENNFANFDLMSLPNFCSGLSANGKKQEVKSFVYFFATKAL